MNLRKQQRKKSNGTWCKQTNRPDFTDKKVRARHRFH